jgi:hypothetical protein
MVGAKKKHAFVSYGSFRDNNFMQALARLTNHRFKDPKAAYRVMKISKAIEKELPEAQELFLKTVKEYAILDDKGEILPAEEGKHGTYKIKEGSEAAWKEAYTKFQDIKSDLNWPKLTLDDIAGMDVSAADLNALELLVEVEGEPS